MRNNPPKMGRWLLERFLIKYNQAPALGDLEEEFEFLIQEFGIRKARHWYRRQVLKSIPACLNHLLYWRFAMFRSYLKIAFRNIQKQKIYSFIKEFLYLVIISNIIAIPLAYLCSKSLIQSITAYTTDIGFGVFILAAFITLITAAVAVTSQTLKAARANPVDVLKYE